MQFTNDNRLVKIAVADDHSLLRESLSAIIDTWENCKVVIQAANGRQLLEKISVKNLPTLALIDLSMPVMNGYETIKAVKEKFPEIKLMAISLYNSEEMILQLIKCGADGFVNKNDDIPHFKKAITEMMHTGYFFSDHVASKMIKKALRTGTITIKNDLSENELIFLKHLCSDKTYKEIAHEMGLAERQAEYMRVGLFEKFGAKSRTGLAVTAMNKGLTV